MSEPKYSRSRPHVTEAVDPEEKTVYEMYYDRAEALAKIPNSSRAGGQPRRKKKKKLEVLSFPPLETEKIHEVIARIRHPVNEKSIFCDKSLKAPLPMPTNG